MIKVIAFDLFGTVFDPATADKADIHRYVDCIRASAWTDLGNVSFPSFWNIKPFPDSVEGLGRLRKDFKIVAASNWYPALVESVSDDNKIIWDAIMDFREVKAFKPKLVTYAHICDKMRVRPDEVLFITGNKGAGDDTNPQKIGMRSILIRQPEYGYPTDIISLADYLSRKEEIID